MPPPLPIFNQEGAPSLSRAGAEYLQEAGRDGAPRQCDAGVTPTGVHTQAGRMRTRRRPPQSRRPPAHYAFRSTSCAQGAGHVADLSMVAGRVAEAAARLHTLLASVVAQRLMEPAPASGTP